MLIRQAMLTVFIFAMSLGQAVAMVFNFSVSDQAALVKSLVDKEYGSVSSLLISSDDHILFEFYADEFDKDTLHNTRSVGKTVTGILLGIAIDQGKIPGVDARIASYFKELQPFENPDSRKNEMTLQDLLTMSNPLECNDWNSFSRGNEERMYLVEDWSGFFLNLPVRARPSWEVPDQPKYSTAFSYCTAGAQIVGEIIQRSTGKDIAEFSEAHFFSLLGISNAKWNRASTGIAHMGGGLELNSRDWLKIAQLLASEGEFNGNTVLPKAWVNEMFTARSNIEEGMDYGYFSWLPEKQDNGKKIKIGMLSGTGGNRIYALPEHEIAVVITKNAYRDRQAHETSDKLFEDQILRKLRDAKK